MLEFADSDDPSTLIFELTSVPLISDVGKALLLLGPLALLPTACCDCLLNSMIFCSNAWTEVDSVTMISTLPWLTM